MSTTTENKKISAADPLCLSVYGSQKHNLTSAEFLYISELTETTRPNTTTNGGIYHEVTNLPIEYSIVNRELTLPSTELTAY